MEIFLNVSLATRLSFTWLTVSHFLIYNFYLGGSSSSSLHKSEQEKKILSIIVYPLTTFGESSSGKDKGGKASYSEMSQV